MKFLVFWVMTVATLQLPAQYKGWTNDCSLFFQDQAYSNLEQNFIYCKIQACDEHFFQSCNHKSAYRSMNLSECMALCCSKNSKYEPFRNILNFLDQCQTDYFKDVNAKIQKENWVPYVILGLLFGIIVLAIFFVFGCFFYEDALKRFRDRYFGRGQTRSYEMRFLRR